MIVGSTLHSRLQETESCWRNGPVQRNANTTLPPSSAEAAEAGDTASRAGGAMSSEIISAVPPVVDWGKCRVNQIQMSAQELLACSPYRPGQADWGVGGGMPCQQQLPNARNPEQPAGIEATLAERGNNYGEFTGHATLSQKLKALLQDHAGWNRLAWDQREALDMVMHKIARIINGNPDYVDSWHDIIGYVRLVEKRLEKQ